MAAGWVVDVRMGRRRGGDGERRFEGATNRAGAGKPRTWEDSNKYLKSNSRNVVKSLGMQQITMKTALGQVPGLENQVPKTKLPRYRTRKKQELILGRLRYRSGKNQELFYEGYSTGPDIRTEKPGTFLP